jgi:hypothetical protein
MRQHFDFIMTKHHCPVSGHTDGIELVQSPKQRDSVCWLR